MPSTNSQPQPCQEFDELDLSRVRGTLRSMIDNARADPALRDLYITLQTAGLDTTEGKIGELEQAVESKGELPESLVRVIIDKRGKARDQFAIME